MIIPAASRYVIYVKEGVYEEQVEVGSNMINITMYGDGSRKTIVTGSKNYVDGVKTFHTATFGKIITVISFIDNWGKDYLLNFG